MFYRIVSDIHSEFWPESQTKARRLADIILPPLPHDAETILLLPGDTGSYRRRNVYRWLVERFAERFLAVYDIPGNHYAYGGTDWDVCESPSPVANYRLGATMHQGRITAATLWADFQRGNPIVEEQCRVGMNDFRQIDGITVEKVKTRHREHLAFLEAHIEPGAIVMTHFAPSWQSISPAYGSSELNGYYATDLQDMILRKCPALWVHGHIHSRSDYRIGETRVICNPAGYEGRDHEARLVVEV